MAMMVAQFDDFIHQVYGYTPFPWQRMLVERLAGRLEKPSPSHEQLWPRGIDLPTASGKTTCLDIAVYTLALSVESGTDRIAPRRIFFVVDRRIVVDEAYNRARKLAQTLADAREGIVAEVAECLRELSGTDTPLVACRMRGGVRREEGWVDNPAQPAIITSPVDQVGSRLLFRGYGPGKLTQSIHAGLIGCDSLVFLDEAHCAVPFMETAEAVRRYAGQYWVEEQVSRPLEFIVLSATLPKDAQQDCFPAEIEKAAAFDADELRRRIETPKPAELAVARKPGKRDWSLGKAITEDVLVLDAAQRAADLAVNGQHRRIAIMVNRVATAVQIFRQLDAAAKHDGPLDAGSVLVTGRIRPIDRDDLLNRWERYLRANEPDHPERPIILVTTQCLEVGADFSFDALITECASLDALRQRFGRLNRLGNPDLSSIAAILIRKEDVIDKSKLDEIDKKLSKGQTLSKNEEKLVDPIYGLAKSQTWNWLGAEGKRSEIDMSTKEIQALLTKEGLGHGVAKLSAPSLHAPVMLPVHLDFLCQTAPRPEPDPDVSLFLHGPNRGVPEAQVVFRADLFDSADDQAWLDTVSLLPPLSAEALSVPLPRLRRWLADQQTMADDPTGDVETQSAGSDEEKLWGQRKFVLWRGRQDSQVMRNPFEVQPNDTVVVPVSDKKWIEKLGHYFTWSDGGAPLDVAERVYLQMRGYAVLRANRVILERWQKMEPVENLLAWAENEDRNIADRDELLQALSEYRAEEGEPALPDWLREAARRCMGGRQPTEHPVAGLLLQERRQKPEWDEFADDTASVLDEPVYLLKHTDHVVQTVEDFTHTSRRLVPPSVREMLICAARFHDSGKSDDRFQAYLNGGYFPGFQEKYLAKGNRLRTTPSRRRIAREQAELPENFRHEMLSMQLAEISGQLPEEPDKRDLILHLIASHHGHARPFAPVCIDRNPTDVKVSQNGTEIVLSSADRRKLIPAHRLDSGVSERFWRLTRRYGWWGLAFLEAILRLADWRASSLESDAGNQTGKPSQLQEVNA